MGAECGRPCAHCRGSAWSSVRGTRWIFELLGTVVVIRCVTGLTYLRKTGETDHIALEARLPGDGRTATIFKDPDLRGYVWLSASKIVLDRWEAPRQAILESVAN